MASPANQPPPPARNRADGLSAEEVRKVAKLARLTLSDEQVERSRRELGAILHYVDRLSTLDLKDVEPLASPLEIGGRLGADVEGESLPTEALLRMAPAAAFDAFVKVPKVLGSAGGGSA